MFPQHIQYIIDNYSTPFQVRLRGEEINIATNQAIDTLLACDPSQGKKLTDWLVKTYCSGGFLWEDVEAEAESKLAEVLRMYQTYFHRIPRDQRNIYDYPSYGELYKTIEPYLPIERVDDTQGSREIKRRERARALEESEVLYRSEQWIVAVPLTENAAKWWGKGTKWCTSAVNNNRFDYYNEKAPLIIITLLNQSSGSSLRNESSSRGNTEKFQLWTHDNNVQFMDARDSSVEKDIIQRNWHLLKPIILSTIEINGNIISLIPDNYITEEFCSLAVSQSGMALRYIPRKFITAELCRIAVKQNGLSLNHVPDKLKTSDLCVMAIEQNGRSLAYISDKLRTIEMCWQAIKQNGLAITDIPDKITTAEMCLIAVEQNGLALYYMKEKHLTLDICTVATKQNGQSLGYVPERFKTIDVCMNAFNQDASIINLIPECFRTFEMYEHAVSVDGTLLFFVPPYYQSPEMCRRAVQQNPRAINYISECLRTDELLALAQVKKPVIRKWEIELLANIKDSLVEHFKTDNSADNSIKISP